MAYIKMQTITGLHLACPYSTDKLKTNIRCNAKGTSQYCTKRIVCAAQSPAILLVSDTAAVQDNEHKLTAVMCRHCN